MNLQGVLTDLVDRFANATLILGAGGSICAHESMLRWQIDFALLNSRLFGRSRIVVSPVSLPVHMCLPVLLKGRSGSAFHDATLFSHSPTGSTSFAISIFRHGAAT